MTTLKADPIAIKLVAFGTTRMPARKVYDNIADAVRQRFPQHPVSWAFTSSIIRRRLTERGLTTQSPAAAIEEAEANGVKRLVMQSLHVVPGEEFHRFADAAAAARHARIAVGRPLLGLPEDVQRVAETLRPQFRDDAVNVVVAHGHSNIHAYNERNYQLKELLESRYDNVLLASVEGPDGDKPLEQARRLARQTYGRVRFVPLMLVSGLHIQDDVLGDNPNSWQHRVGEVPVDLAPPLGDIPEIVDLWLDHLAEAFTELQTREEAAV